MSVAKNGVNRLLTYSITNTSTNTSAFGIRVQLLNNAGQQILPAIVDDSYFSLMRGESKKLLVEVAPPLLTKGYKLSARAYNN